MDKLNNTHLNIVIEIPKKKPGSSLLCPKNTQYKQ